MRPYTIKDWCGWKLKRAITRSDHRERIHIQRVAGVYRDQVYSDASRWLELKVVDLQRNGRDKALADRIAHLHRIHAPNWRELFELELLLIVTLPRTELLTKYPLACELNHSRGGDVTSNDEEKRLRDYWEALLDEQQARNAPKGVPAASLPYGSATTQNRALPAAPGALATSPAMHDGQPDSREEMLRAHMLNMTAQMQWEYRKLVEREASVGRTRLFIICTSFVLLLCWVVGPSLAAQLPWLESRWETLAIQTALGFGLLGAFTSMMRRFNAIQPDTDDGVPQPGSARLLASIDFSRWSLFSALVVGSVFGFLIYPLCVSGLLDGSAFPAFSNDRHLLPELRNIAKLAVWSFIAGFGEKFVPDIIDRLDAMKVEPK
ncbi:MAG TPA: hypothetical protein VLC08_08850 [Chitinolyticbacter sp.]|nr:hypothetical protein [Chitinolyticbacter sp.]